MQALPPQEGHYQPCAVEGKINMVVITAWLAAVFRHEVTLHLIRSQPDMMKQGQGTLASASGW